MQRHHQQPETNKVVSSAQQTEIKNVDKNLMRAGTSKEPTKESPLSKEMLGLGAFKGLAVGLKTNACHHCGLIYSRSDNLKAHIKRKHLNEDRKPSIKTEAFNSEKEMTTEDPTFCKICNKKFSRKDKLKDHNKKKHEFCCKVCGIVFVKRYTLEQHIEQFHRSETKEDAEQPTPAKRKSTTDAEETAKKKLKTNAPEKKSAGLSEYHYRSDGVYHCRLCDKSYSRGNHVVRHAKATHFKNGKQLEKQVADPEKVTATETRKDSPKSTKSLNLVSQSVKKAQRGIQRIDKTSAIAAQNLGKQTAVSEISVSRDQPNQTEQKNGSDIKIKCPNCFKFTSSMKELISHMRTEH